MTIRLDGLPPWVGRFLMGGPDHSKNQGVMRYTERYAYVNNSPIFFVDPSGNKACDQIDENGNCEVDLDWQSSKTPEACQAC